MTLCVYAVTAGIGRRPRPRGLRGEPLREVRVGSVVAIAGTLHRAPEPSPSSLRRYDRVVRALWSERPALLPARFGTCFPSLEALTMTLGGSAPSLVRDLRRVRHRAQMTVRILGPVGDRELGTGDRGLGVGGRRSGLGDQGTGGQYLRARAALAAQAREARGIEPLRAAVKRWTRDERVDVRKTVATVYHLVPRASRDAYRRAVERAAASEGLRVVVTGPHPPYAFA